MAAGAALSAERGDIKVSDFEGASCSMYKCMSERNSRKWPRAACGHRTVADCVDSGNAD
ncbi:DUF3008 family protein [uncultured Devosia sp.]|uniref:DUF3008 family protein n=1 Tax=uncultured Devosia sp. TaxID=211434 RepID=UPI0026103BF1|nr:DUF3008 family protein [uncultured Devosia sp.]